MAVNSSYRIEDKFTEYPSVSYTPDERKEIRQVRKVNSLDFRNGEIKWLII